MKKTSLAQQLMTFSFLSTRNFSFHGVTSAVLPLSHCQLLIGQKCAPRDVSFSCFCPFQSDRLSRNSASIWLCFPPKISFIFKGTQSQTPKLALGDFTSSDLNHHYKTFQPAQLGSALCISWHVLAPRLCFLLFFLFSCFPDPILVLRAGTDIPGRKHNSLLCDLPASHLPLLQMLELSHQTCL